MTSEQYKVFLKIISIQKLQFKISNSDLRKIDIGILPFFVNYLTEKPFNAIFNIKELGYDNSLYRITLSDSLWSKHYGYWLNRAENYTLNYVMKSFCKYKNIEWDNCYSSDNIMIYLQNTHDIKFVRNLFMLDLRDYTQGFIIYIQNRLKNKNHND